MLWSGRQPVRSPGFCEKRFSLTRGTGIRQACPGLAVLSVKLCGLGARVGAVGREFKSSPTREVVVIAIDRRF